MTPSRFFTIMLPLLFMAVQIQFSFFANEHSKGIRLNAGDLLLPLAGAAILYTLLRRQTLWPRWDIPGAWIWLAALSAVFTYALFNFYFLHGEWSQWALINKYVGWYVLAAYFCLGGWTAANMDAAKKERLLRFFCLFFIAGMAVSITIHAADMALPDDIGGWEWLEAAARSPLHVLMGNRNAWMMLFISSVLLISVHEMTGSRLVPDYCSKLMWFLIPFAFLYNGSRAGWLVFLVFLPIIAFENKSIFLKKCLPALMAGLIAASLYTSVNSRSFLSDCKYFHIARIFVAASPETVPAANNILFRDYQGDTSRKGAYTNALRLWLEHPVGGAGMGAILAEQRSKENAFPDIADNTTLWLLAETGFAGNTAFISFYALCLLSLWRKKEHPLQKSLFYTLIAFGMLSLAHELLYTRFLWLLMGLALAHPPRLLAK